jgi:hypothetical protein
VGAAFTTLLAIHLVCVSGATLAFWTAAFVDKGGAVHRWTGRWFARLIYLGAATGAAMAVAVLAGRSGTSRPPDPHMMWLVLYVLLIIVVPAQHGLAALAAAGAPLRLRSHLHRSLNGAAMGGSMLLLLASVIWREWLFVWLVPVGLVVGARNLAYARRSSATAAEWQREHLTSMVTAGITIHTALLIFGASRTLDLQLRGSAAFLPWVLPTIVGVPILIWLRRTWRPR